MGRLFSEASKYEDIVSENKLFTPMAPYKISAPADFIEGEQKRITIGGETYVNVIFYDGKVLEEYFISNYGKLWSVRKGDFISQYMDDRGYYRATLTNFMSKSGLVKSIYTGVHKLELMSFVPITQADYFMPNHRDGNPTNNWLGNLEWVTPSKNTTHAIDTNLAKCKGTDNARSYLTDDQVHMICKGLELGKKPPQIANEIGYTVPPYTQIERNRVCAIIRNIKYGDTYREIADQYDFPGTGGVFRYSDDMAEIVCKILAEGNFKTYKDIAERLQIPEKDRIRFRIYIDDILKGKTGTYYSRQYDVLHKPSSEEIV